MNQKKIAFLFLWILITITSVTSQEEMNGLPFITNYEPKEYGAHIQNWDIDQDERGVIYVANVDGLLEFDGENWKLYPLPGEETGRSLDIDSSGRIYMGTSSHFGYFEPNRNGELQYTSLTEKYNIQHETGDVWNTIVLDSIVFFSTYQRVYVYNGDTVFFFNAGENSRFLIDFAYEGDYYAFNLEDGLHTYQDGKLTPSQRFMQLNDYLPFSVSKNPDGQLTFLSQRNLYHFTDENTVKPYGRELNSLLNQSGIYYGLKSVDEKIVIGTLTQGLVIYDPLIDSHFVIDDDKGLQGETVYEIREDRQGNLWLSLSNGISRVEISSPFSYWNKIQGLNAYVTDIFKYNDTVYISTENGIFYLDGKGVKKIGTLNDQCWDIHLFKGERGEKQLLAGTNSGLFEIKNNRLINHYNRPTMVVSSLYSTPEFPELLFVGQTDGFSVLKNTGDEWKEIEYIENTGYDIRSIARDKEGNFWIGTFRKGVIKGQYFPEAQRFVITKHYGENSGFPSLKNVNVFPYSKHLVFGTEKGFYKYDSRRDTFIIDSVFGEPYITGSSGVFAFEETENNKVWVTGLNSRHSKLGYGIPDKDGIYRWTFEPFERLPGMMTLALFVESDSIFWIGGSEGIYKYNSRNNYNYGKNHKTLLRNIFVGKDSLIFAGNLPISLRKKGKQVVEWEEPVDFKYNTVSFYFSLPFFDGKSSNSYQYYLEGFDKDWSDWQSTGFKQYTNLPEGDYVFHARGKNIYNQIAREAIFRFTVNPPWYRTFLAYIIYVLLGAFIIWVIIRIYTNNLKAANIRLEEKVKERTHEIAQQKEEIEQQRDSIYNQARQLELINAELNKLSIAVRETDNAIILMDKEGKLEWINEGFTRLYGYNIEEAKEYLGQYPVKEKKNEKLKEHFKKVIEDNSSHIYESSITAKSGEHIVTQTTLTPITDESGEISYVVAIDSDIRKLKQVEEELQKLNATKDKFFSIIAHDLKNPFHSLVAAIKTLRMKINDYPKDKILYFLENMEDVAEKGYDLLINLLEWSRSQTGRLNFRTEEYNLHDLVKSSIDLLKTYANNKGVKIMNQVDKSVSVKADKNTISTVLRNLISNAIKYSTKGDKVRIYCKEKEGFCYVYVEDTGIGIKKEDLNKLFRIDQNFSTRGTQEEAGTGLGLILCKEFVEKNGGEIFVESEPGKGTTFSFYLQKG